MNRYQNLFNMLKKKKEGCFVPFLVLGDPSVNTCLKIIDNFISLGVADALELGIPFSDPLADGSIIQNANLRAFKTGITLDKCFKMLSIIRKRYNALPIGLLIYANIIFRYGIQQFYYKCALLEIDSVLIADVPMEEYYSYRKIAFQQKISPVFICPPNATTDLIKKIAIFSNSYIYVVSRSGITGRKNQEITNTQSLAIELKKHCSTPLLQGFGLYTPIQVKNAIASGMSGVICGSVIIRKIEKYYHNYELMIKKINKLVLKLKKSTCANNNL